MTTCPDNKPNHPALYPTEQKAVLGWLCVVTSHWPLIRWETPVELRRGQPRNWPSTYTPVSWQQIGEVEPLGELDSAAAEQKPIHLSTADVVYRSATRLLSKGILATVQDIFRST